MRKLLGAICLSLISASAVPALGGDAWPRFRGPTQDGYSDAKDLPTTWSDTQNIKWKTAIEGKGWSSPVILDKQIWMTTAVDGGKSLRAICVDQDTGKIIYNIDVLKEQTLEAENDLNSYASPSPVIEPGRVYVSYGRYGNACIDTKTGKILWTNTDLQITHMEGAGSSPILWGPYFIMHCDGTDLDYVVFLDKMTGQVAHKFQRTFPLATLIPSERKAFSIPTVATINGQEQLISLGSRRVSGISLPDARELWHVDLPGYSNVPMPVYKDGTAYISTGFMNPELWAIRPGETGEGGTPPVIWKWKTGAPLKPSVMVIDDLIFFISDNGILRCLETKTGKQVWQHRILGTVSASPVYAGGLIYYCDEHGKCVVIRPGRKEDVVAENQLDSRIMASPAIVGNALYIRTETSLYRIEK